MLRYITELKNSNHYNFHPNVLHILSEFQEVSKEMQTAVSMNYYCILQKNSRARDHFISVSTELCGTSTHYLQFTDQALIFNDHAHSACSGQTSLLQILFKHHSILNIKLSMRCPLLVANNRNRAK